MTNPDNVGGLLPCPFCGASAAELSDTVAIGVTDAQFMHTIVCNVNHGGCGATSGYDWEADKAIAAWNRRAELYRASPAGGDVAPWARAYAELAKAVGREGFDINSKDGGIYLTAKDSAPAGSGEVEDWMVELFDEVYEREWNRAADEADDRHKAIIGPADRHATREAIAAILRKLSTAGSGEVEARDAYSRIIKALAAIACVHTPDDLFDLNAIPRDPVMLQVMRIRQAADDLSALLRKLQQGADENSLRAVAKRNLRSLINIGSDDKALMLKCLEELS